MRSLWLLVAGLAVGLTLAVTYQEVLFWLRYRYWRKPDRIVVGVGFVLFALFALMLAAA